MPKRQHVKVHRPGVPERQGTDQVFWVLLDSRPLPLTRPFKNIVGIFFMEKRATSRAHSRQGCHSLQMPLAAILAAMAAIGGYGGYLAAMATLLTAQPGAVSEAGVL